MKRIVLPVMLGLSFVIAVSAQTPPYVKTFITLNTINVANSAELVTALQNAQPKTRILLQDGVTYTGPFTVDVSNVMIDCAGHCIITGDLTLNQSGDWLRGVHKRFGDFNVFGSDDVVVNNVFEGPNVLGSSVGIGIWSQASGTPVVYGNIAWAWKHDLYIQNSAPAQKYVVNNLFLETHDASNGYAIHEYTQDLNKTEKVTYLHNTVVANSSGTGGFIIGGENAASAPILNEVQENVIYRSSLSLGYKRPNQLQITQNLFWKSELVHDHIWGTNDQGICGHVPPSTPNTVTNNTFAKTDTNARNVFYQTSRVIFGCMGACPCWAHAEGDTLLRVSDDVDFNTYYKGFKGQLITVNGNFSETSLTNWRTDTSNSGNQYDEHSTVITSSAPNGYKLWTNEYNTDRAYLTIYSLTGSSTVNVTFPRSGSLYNPKNAFGSSTFAFTAGTVSVPLSGEMQTYLVKYN